MPVVNKILFNMNFSFFRCFFIIGTSLGLASCSLDLLGHSKNGTYMGMGHATNGMSDKTFIPKKIQREEPIF